MGMHLSNELLTHTTLLEYSTTTYKSAPSAKEGLNNSKYSNEIKIMQIFHTHPHTHAHTHTRREVRKKK